MLSEQPCLSGWSDGKSLRMTGFPCLTASSQTHRLPDAQPARGSSAWAIRQALQQAVADKEFPAILVIPAQAAASAGGQLERFAQRKFKEFPGGRGRVLKNLRNRLQPAMWLASASWQRCSKSL